jgi:predicted Rossmann-fold nucleotide-binding protein
VFLRPASPINRLGTQGVFTHTLVKEGTISPNDSDLFTVVDDAESAIAYILKHQKDITEPLSEGEQKTMMEI